MKNGGLLQYKYQLAIMWGGCIRGTAPPVDIPCVVQGVNPYPRKDRWLGVRPGSSLKNVE